MVSRYDPEVHHRRSMRLPGYDYAQAGAYFVTICTHDRECLFGEIDHDEMALNAFGEIARDEWLKSSEIRAEIRLGAFVVMPNHFHGIVQIIDKGGGRDIHRRGDRPVAPTNGAPTPRVNPTPGPKSKSIGAMVGGYKSAVATRINALRNNPGAPVWQRNYHDHIIRDEADYNRIVEYITHNPQRWAEDSLNPAAPAPRATIVGATGRSPSGPSPRSPRSQNRGPQSNPVEATDAPTHFTQPADTTHPTTDPADTAPRATIVGATGRSPLRRRPGHGDE